MGDEKIAPKKKYEEMKALFDEHGWSAFDKEQKMLFDNLDAKFGKALFDNGNAVQKTAFDIKPSALAARDKAIADRNSSHRDDRDLDKEGSRKFYLRPSRPFPPNEIQPVNDGESLRKVRGTDRIWRDAVDRWNVADLAEPVNYRAIGACYDAEYPEKENPDYRAGGTGIIQPGWKPPEYEKTTDRATVLAEKLKVLLDFRNQDS